MNKLKIVKCVMCGADVPAYTRKKKYCKKCKQIAKSQASMKCYYEKKSGGRKKQSEKTTKSKKQIVRKEIYKLRPLTKDTKFLVCLWHSQRSSISEIADLLQRPIVQIEGIIENCKNNGSYDRYVQIHKDYVKSVPKVNSEKYYGKYDANA